MNAVIWIASLTLLALAPNAAAGDDLSDDVCAQGDPFLCKVTEDMEAFLECSHIDPATFVGQVTQEINEISEAAQGDAHQIKCAATRTTYGTWSQFVSPVIRTAECAVGEPWWPCDGVYNDIVAAECEVWEIFGAPCKAPNS